MFIFITFFSQDRPKYFNRVRAQAKAMSRAE